MRSFAHHYSDTPHGASHAPISISVLLTVLFIGAQWIYRTVSILTGRLIVAGWSGPDDGFVGSFNVISLVIAGLLLAFLIVDLRRNRLEAHGAQRYQYVVFGVAALLLAAFIWYLAMTMAWVGPLA
jgi:hypothetical protein